MSNTKQTTNYNNNDLRCGELLTVRLNCSHYETLYIEKHEEDDEGQMTGINYKDDAHAEAIWSEINTRATYLYEKVWSETWERTEEILYAMEEIFNDYNVEFDYYDSEVVECFECETKNTDEMLKDNNNKCAGCDKEIDHWGNAVDE
tara:strand:+ start:6908 stop:7348 length:441 start_codon:yes stop_codon:yes gene_type:complete